MSQTSNIQVLIVGAGPSGLMMACQLAMYGIAFRIIEKRVEKTAYSGALIIQPRTLEILDYMGLTKRIMADGVLVNRIRSCFKSKCFTMDMDEFDLGLSKFPYMILHEQIRTMKLLQDFIEEKNHSVEFGTELITLTSYADNNDCVLGLADGSFECITVPWLIAADSGKSIVRQQLGVIFQGSKHEQDLFLLDCEAESSFGSGELFFFFSEKSGLGVFPLKDNKYRIDGTIPKNATECEPETLLKPYDEFIKIKKTLFCSTFHSQGMVASTMQHNRCFLIGDAAHVFSPIGAQGMNTGMQDAHNLAWKLAYVIKGYSDDSLLNSYQEERHNLAKKHVLIINRLFSFLTSEKKVVKILKLHVVPSVLKALFHLPFIKKLLRTRVYKAISELGINYRKSGHGLSLGKFSKNAPKPGDRLPYAYYFKNNIKTNIQDCVNVNLCLLVFYENLNIPLEELSSYSRLLEVEKISYLSENFEIFNVFGIKKFGMYLVRPDGYIALRSSIAEVVSLKSFLKQQFFIANNDEPGNK